MSKKRYRYWIYRNQFGELQLTLTKGEMFKCGNNFRATTESLTFTLEEDEFPNVRFQNSPVEVELKIKGQNNDSKEAQ